MKRAVLTANYCTSPFLPTLFLCTFVVSPSLSPSLCALNMEELICSFCRQHLFSIYLSTCVFSLSLSPPLSGRAVLSGPSRAAGLSGVMDDYQPSAVFHYAPGRFTGSLTTRHENQSLFLILPSLPPSKPASLLPSRSSISTSPLLQKKKSFHNVEMCAKQHWNLCVDRGKQLLLLRITVDVSEGRSILRVIRLVFDRLSCPSLSSSSPLLPAPSQTSNTWASIHVPLAGGNYNIGKRCWANCCLKIVIALLSRPFLVMIVQRHYVNAIKWFHYYSCLH